MSNLLSTGDAFALTGAFYDLWLTETNGRTITVFKQPQKTFAANNAANIYGYGEDAAQTNYTFSPVSGVYPAVVRYGTLDSQNEFADIHSRIPQSDVFVKIQQDARDFISNGHTENVLIDGRSYNLTQEESNQFYFGLKFYYVGLVRTK